MESAQQGSTRLKNFILASLFAALTAAGAFIRIPIAYVPITLQTFSVLLAGSVLGAKYGALSQVIYLAVGLLGAPIFSQGGGPGYVLQPTFGYLLGYPIAAFAIGRWLWGRNSRPSSTSPSFVKTCLVMSVGVLLIFIPGVTGLYLNLNYVAGKPIALSRAVWVGFLVFVPGDIIKITVSAWATVKLSKILPAD
ncbi:MAG: biotin transporter BioY [bacterium]